MEEGIEAVLSKAIELRLKISNCIHNAAATTTNSSSNLEEDKNKEIDEKRTHSQNVKQEEDEETERLFYIRDALESLENQLSNLRALQQQQNYERQAALLAIEHSRKMLVEKLNDYKGGNLEVIQEASAFAADTVAADESDLLLPPYPTRPLQAVQFSSTTKSSRNGIAGETKKNLNHVESNRPQNMPSSSTGRFGHLIGATAKTLITIVGVVSLLSLTGLGPHFGKKGFSIKISNSTEDDRHTALCPPGKILVIEGGEARCVVKERIAVPFDSTVAKPDVNYGSG